MSEAHCIAFLLTLLKQILNFSSQAVTPQSKKIFLSSKTIGGVALDQGMVMQSDCMDIHVMCVCSLVVF